MGLRPARCYRDITQQSYTRTAKRVMKKAFVTGVPGTKLHTFDMGNVKGKFDTEISLVAMEPKQLRHNQLEAARIAANQPFAKLPMDAYYMKVRVYPHHVLRENPLASGAGADRFQTGMAKAFGKPYGRAARVKAGQRIFTIKTNKENANLAKEAFRMAMIKLSGKFRISISPIK